MLVTPQHAARVVEFVNANSAIPQEVRDWAAEQVPAAAAVMTTRPEVGFPVLVRDFAFQNDGATYALCLVLRLSNVSARFNIINAESDELVTDELDIFTTLDNKVSIVRDSMRKHRSVADARAAAAAYARLAA